MKLITKSVIRKLLKMKLRIVGILLVIAFASAMLLMGLYGAGSMDATVEYYVEESKMPDVFVEFSSPQNESDVEAALQASPDVDVYDMRLRAQGIYTYKGEIFSALLYGIRDPDNDRISELGREKGRMFSASGEAVVIKGMEDQGAKPGATAEVLVGGQTINLSVTGTVKSPEHMFASSYIDYSIPVTGTLVIFFMPLEDLQAVIGDGVNDIVVLYADGGSAKGVSEDLDAFGVSSVMVQEDHPSVAYMKVGADKFRGMMPLMSAVFMFIGFISIFMTVYRLVQNDSRYIGVMMSLGYTRREIVRGYMVMGLVLAVIGSILGLILGVIFTIGVVDAAVNMYGSMDIIMPFLPVPLVITVVYTFLLVLLSVYLPVRAITRQSVREALDYKPRVRIRKYGAGSGRMSRTTLMGLRNATRNPGRTALTVFVVGMTIGAAGSWLVMMDSAMGHVFDNLDAEEWDLRVDLLSPMDEDDVNATFLGLDEGEATDIVHFSHLTVLTRHGGEKLGANLMTSDGLTTVKDFNKAEGKLDFSGAVITNMLGKELGAGVGDTITLEVGADSVDLKVTGIVYDAMLYAVYTGRDPVAAFVPTTQVSGVYILLEDPGRAEELAEDIRYIPEVSNVVIQKEIVDTLEEIIGTSMGMLWFFFFINIIIAFVVSGSAVIISSMERDVEYATLDTLGIPRARVAKSILLEMSILGVLSAAIGIPVAYLLGEVFAMILEEVIFYFPVVFAFGITMVTFLAGFAFVMFSSAIPIRYAGKLDTEKTLRERTAG